MSHRRALVALLPLAAALLLGGCTGNDSDGKGGQEAGGAGPSVIAPGKPGEAASTLPADEVSKARGDDRPNSADVGYMQMMVVHHEQAILMTGLADEHAKAHDVRRIAARIAAGQAPEIEAMKAWLEKNADGAGSGGHEHGAMPGMTSPERLDKLRTARGGDFDDLFLQLMITHHEGAVTMAEEVLGGGNNAFVEQLAGDVIAQQTSEIGRMRDLQ